ncbi:hypothetical protein SCP_0106090 [Sparassis crispa]|uniref:Homeobox domain-containing protein n=1 Tax=Sparassis crispa TaxID=139825 RepID=A0A401G6F2_9APHY|nr:hypothetical protein SCP_0106090 [Sparassis crispa]GBE77727.1 hypothetical protein SCP_0106090 [Sparassis crispa]
MVKSLPASFLSTLPPSESSYDTTPTNDFPTPQPPTSHLIALGIDAKAAHRISQIYMRAALQFKAKCEVQYDRICRVFRQRAVTHPHGDLKLQSRLRDVHLAQYTKMLRLWLEKIIGMVESRLDELRSRNFNETSRKNTRLPFNQGAIPILEKFFERNAFPSRAEKEQLASIADMDYKQINIWFQNRRSRSKKQGKSLTKGTTFVGLPSDLADVMADFMTEDNSLRSHRSPGLDDEKPGNTFNVEAPPHAFPTLYPPLCSYNPFPSGLNARRFTSPWFRKALPRVHWSSPSPNFALFTRLFARMSIFDSEKKECESTKTSSTPSHSSIPVGFATILPHVPSPTLLHPPVVASSSSTPIVPSARLVQRTHRRSSLPSTPDRMSARFTPYARSRIKTSSTSRKVPMLPKRLPTNSSINHRGFPPAASDVATSSSLPSPSKLTRSPSPSSAPTDRSTKTDPNVSEKPQLIPSSVVSMPRRNISSLPKRAKIEQAAEPSAPPAVIQFSHTPYSRTISRSSSLSSLSSEASSTSYSEIETPFSTPPLLPVGLPDPKTSTSAFALDPAFDFSDLYSAFPLERSLLDEGSELDLLLEVLTAK